MSETSRSSYKLDRSWHPDKTVCQVCLLPASQNRHQKQKLQLLSLLFLFFSLPFVCACLVFRDVGLGFDSSSSNNFNPPQLFFFFFSKHVTMFTIQKLEVRLFPIPHKISLQIKRIGVNIKTKALINASHFKCFDCSALLLNKDIEILSLM